MLLDYKFIFTKTKNIFFIFKEPDNTIIFCGVLIWCVRQKVRQAGAIIFILNASYYIKKIAPQSALQLVRLFALLPNPHGFLFSIKDISLITLHNCIRRVSFIRFEDLNSTSASFLRKLKGFSGFLPNVYNLRQKFLKPSISFKRPVLREVYSFRSFAGHTFRFALLHYISSRSFTHSFHQP